MKIHASHPTVILGVAGLILVHALALAFWLRQALKKPQLGSGKLELKKRT